MREENWSFFDWTWEIQKSEQTEIDKLRMFFGRITTEIIEEAQREIELTKAMQDHESLVKQQIKMETIKTARSIFARGYHVATGRRIWDEQDQR